MKSCKVCLNTEPRSWNGLTCSSCYSKAHRLKHLDKIREKDRNRDRTAYDKARYASPKRRDYCRKRSKAYRQRNLEALRAYDRTRYVNRKPYMAQLRLTNIDRVRAVDRARYRRHRPKRIALVMARRAHKGKATPKWLTREQKQQLYDFYVNRPAGFHVDHVVPLKGKTVSGLHVPWNLQYLPASENLRKSNKFE